LQISAEFVTSAAGAGDFPRDRLTEVAMVGRSNVGKSSLINALVRRPMARTSAAPGKTRLANFYRVQRGASPPLYLVDLPGYGYARAQRRGSGQAPASASAREGRDAAAREFDLLADAYFARAATVRAAPGSGLRDQESQGRGFAGAGAHGSAYPDDRSRKAIAVLLLVDSRHPGLDSDLDAWDWVKTRGVPCGIVGTKVDKLTRAERVRNARELESSFDAPVLLVSAQNGEGLEELWKLIARLPKETAA
jgi:GTP-binding protein